jgi:5-methylcytosine-specific restriction enzyme subunit McrC
MPNRIQVFEHGTLAVGEHGFQARQFAALVRYNDRHGCTFFQVGYNRLHFGSFVGVIQVGNLAIEILPKPECEAVADKGKWQRALLQMLRQSGLLKVEAAPEADLHLRQSPLVDVYLDAFLAEVEHLAHSGLAKRYRVTEGNLYKLKGRIQFAQHVRLNLLHRERMFTAHQVYDRDNPFNRILKCALGIVGNLAVRPSLVARAAASLLWFEQVSEARITADTFDRLRFDRNTERDRRALQLARLIILNYSPDLRGGNEHVVAILFDINKLFERFILVQINRAAPQFAERQLRVAGQVSKRFWSSKTIRPDIVASFDDASAAKRVILDTKWKIPKDGQPADDDLKQMYAYNLHLGGHRSVLIYPMAGAHQTGIDRPYAHSASLPANHTHGCATFYINLFDANHRLRRDIGEELIQTAILSSGSVGVPLS